LVTPRGARPLDLTPVGTDDLPPTPPADRNIPAEAWTEAPPELLGLGDDIGEATVLYLRRIGPWLVWRAGPASNGPARWMALHWDDLGRRHHFRTDADGASTGDGPSGASHQRFRTWKEDLHAHR
jgi:hypothetical protein